MRSHSLAGGGIGKAGTPRKEVGAAPLSAPSSRGTTSMALPNCARIRPPSYCADPRACTSPPLTSSRSSRSFFPPRSSPPSTAPVPSTALVRPTRHHHPHTVRAAAMDPNHHDPNKRCLSSHTPPPISTTAGLQVGRRGDGGGVGERAGGRTGWKAGRGTLARASPTQAPDHPAGGFRGLRLCDPASGFQQRQFLTTTRQEQRSRLFECKPQQRFQPVGGRRDALPAIWTRTDQQKDVLSLPGRTRIPSRIKTRQHTMATYDMYSCY